MDTIEEDFRNKLKEPIEGLINDLIYTVTYDLTNDLIEGGLDPKHALEVANKRADTYAKEGFKIRKKPAARTPRVAKPAEPKPSAASAARNVHKGGKAAWKQIPDDPAYVYYDMPLPHAKTSYLVKEVRTDKVIGVIRESAEGMRRLKEEDIKVATAMGMNVQIV